MTVLSVFALALLAILGAGWLVPFVVGIVRLKQGTGGVVLTVLGAIWGVGVGLIALLALLSYRQFEQLSEGTMVKPEQFEAARYRGEMGTIELSYKGESRLEVRQRQTANALRLSTADGVVKAPVGEYQVTSYEAVAKDEKGAEWVARCLPNQRVTVKAGSAAPLSLGPPLKAEIRLRSAGKDMVSMDLRLTATAGGAAQYTIEQHGGRSEPPSFVALDKAGKVVWQGRFAYG